MSRRTLSRRFREETGLSLMAWLADARIDRAREILETTTEPVENIGRLTGLGAPVSVRAAFHRRIGISPKEYRAVWRGSFFPLVSLRQARPRDDLELRSTGEPRTVGIIGRRKAGGPGE